MPETDFPLAYDFVTARRIANLLNNEGIRAVAEEYEIGMAHIRLDPDGEAPSGYFAVASDTSEDGNSDGGWVMIPTQYHEDLHTYENLESPALESLDVPLDADPQDVADAILNFLA